MTRFTNHPIWLTALVVLLPLLAVHCDTLQGGPSDHDNEQGLQADVAPEPRPAPLAAPGQGLADRIASADQILHGTVTGIAYASSADKGPSTMVIPHTFVTVEVLTALKAGAAGDTVTLRFLGGKLDEETWVSGSDIPMFGIGDEVVLFVAGNGKSACPLVGCSTGLMRISGGMTYDAAGYELFVRNDGILYRGRFAAIPEATVFDLDGNPIQIVSSTVRSTLKVGSNGAMPVEQFVSWLEGKIQEVHSPTKLRVMPSVASADPTVPFVINVPVGERPTFAPEMLADEGTMNEADRAELEALQANDFNPVLPDR